MPSPRNGPCPKPLTRYGRQTISRSGCYYALVTRGVYLMTYHATPAKRSALGPTVPTLTLSSDPPECDTPIGPKLKRHKSEPTKSPSIYRGSVKENVSLTGLADRAQLERERVARQGPQHTARPSVPPRQSDIDPRVKPGPSVLGKARTPVAAVGGDPSGGQSCVGTASRGGAGSNHDQRFWAGAFRKVPNIYGQVAPPTVHDTISRD